MTKLCSDLYSDFRHEGWNEYDLATLPAKELKFLCCMAGFPHSGTKENVIIRLLSLRICRLELAKFSDDPQLVSGSFTRSRMKWMCTQAHLWKSGNKLQLAAVLLKWRNTCRFEGQKFYQQCVALGKSKPHQLKLL